MHEVDIQQRRQQQRGIEGQAQAGKALYAIAHVPGLVATPKAGEHEAAEKKEQNDSLWPVGKEMQRCKADDCVEP